MTAAPAREQRNMYGRRDAAYGIPPYPWAYARKMPLSMVWNIVRNISANQNPNFKDFLIGSLSMAWAAKAAFFNTNSQVVSLRVDVRKF